MTSRKRNIGDNFENSELKMFPENSRIMISFLKFTLRNNNKRSWIMFLDNSDVSWLFYSKREICNMPFRLQKSNYLAKSKRIRYDPLWFHALRTFLKHLLNQMSLSVNIEHIH